MKLGEHAIFVEIVDEIESDFAFDVEELLTNALRTAASHEGIEAGEVVVSLVDDERIRELNRDYRDKDALTDVLSFAIQESDEEEPMILFEEDDDVPVEPLGDIIISIPTAVRQAKEYGHSLERELAFLAVHGFLHLVGYDHLTEEDEKEMFGRQETILANLGLTRG